MSWLLFVVSGLVAYLVGGLNLAILLSKVVYKKDIRTVGSGNPGFTNFKRCFGNKLAWFVFLFDAGKCAVLCTVYGIMFHVWFDMWQIGVSYVGFMTMLGHCFPVWYGFHGGKGFLVNLSAIFFIDWRVGLVSLGVFMLLLFTVRFMSLASMVESLVAPLGLTAVGLISNDWPTSLILAIAFATASALLLIYRHKSNIAKLVEGKESKFYLKGKKQAS